VRWQVPPGTADGGAARRLLERVPALADPAATPLADRFAAGEVVDAHGRAWAAEDLVGTGDELWFHRELREEQVPTEPLPILFRDEHLLVIDKPHDVATMPRGAHVLASALVRLRRATGIEELVPLHRLDRRTAGVLAFGVRPAERSAYQQLFARREVDKGYEALVRPGPSSTLPRAVGARALLADRMVKERGVLTAAIVPGEPDAFTELEVLAVLGARGGPGAPGVPEGPEPPASATGGALHLGLRPRTGRTHQLRLQLSSRGAPILGEDLYPEPCSEPSGPLQLLARSLAFTDPVTGQAREFRSTRTVRWSP
jgi:tRNA pseudouridine32 synthase/23S rRNA pseudouridine746 synthase